MNSSLLSCKNVIVQGITGTHGTFHARAMHASGTNIIAGTSPKKGGQFIDDIPVYESITAIQKQFTVDASVIFVPAPHAKAALTEAIVAGIPLVICITEGIPVHDMLQIHQLAKKHHVTLVGPNCPGILVPGKNKLGIIPYELGLPGNVGIVSRSGTLTYEVTAGLSAKGVGQRYVIGIGGDQIHGIDFVDCLKMFETDPTVSSIVLIGEIGGNAERAAAKYIQESVTKPVYAYIVGQNAPTGVQLGHAGAILGSSSESAQAKTLALKQAGAQTFTSIPELVKAVK